MPYPSAGSCRCRWAGKWDARELGFAAACPQAAGDPADNGRRGAELWPATDLRFQGRSESRQAFLIELRIARGCPVCLLECVHWKLVEEAELLHTTNVTVAKFNLIPQGTWPLYLVQI